MPLHLVDNVQDLHVEIDIGLEQVRSFGNPGECRGEHLVVICGEQPRHATPAPRAVPRAVNENKDGHVFLQEHRRQCMYELRSSPRTWFAAEKSTTEFDRRLFRQETTAPIMRSISAGSNPVNSTSNPRSINPCSSSARISRA